MATVAITSPASDPPRRPLGRLARSAPRHEPGQAGRAGRRDVPRDRGPVRGGGDGRRRRLRGDAPPAGLRAGPDPARDQRRDRRPARGARRAHLPRGRQADPRRARRGRPGGADVPARRRGGRAPGRRDDPARPAAGVPRADRHHPPVPDRTGRRDLAVQLPAQPGRPQAVAGDRGRLLGRPQAALEGPAHDAHRRRDRRGGGPAPGCGEHPADDPRARRPDGRGRAVQAADVHRLAVGRLADEGPGRQEEGRARARRQRRRDRRQERRPRLGRPADPCRRVHLRRPGLHQRPADVRPRGRLGRVHGQVRRGRPGPQARRPGRPADRPRADGRRGGGVADAALGRRGGRARRARSCSAARPTGRSSRRRS